MDLQYFRRLYPSGNGGPADVHTCFISRSRLRALEYEFISASLKGFPINILIILRIPPRLTRNRGFLTSKSRQLRNTIQICFLDWRRCRIFRTSGEKNNRIAIGLSHSPEADYELKPSRCSCVTHSVIIQGVAAAMAAPFISKHQD